MRKHYSLSGSLSELPRFRSHPRTRAGRGFSLIEILGVLAIMGILAGMLAPSVIRQIRQSQASGEDARLRQVGEAILATIQATETIPNPNVAANDAAGWFSLARAYSSMPEDAFRYVYANNSSSERRYFLDPTLDAYLAGLSTPYQTPPDGFPVTGFPAGALRVLLVSSSRGTLNPPAPDDAVLPFAFGANLSGADQNELRNWNKIFTGGVATVPPLPNTPFGANWNGLGEFLHVQTIDLRTLFCKVTLRDLAAPPTAAVVNGTHSYPANAGDPVNGTALGYTFDFVPTPGLGNAFNGGEAGILTSSLKFRTLINRTAALTGFDVKDAGSTPAAGKSTFDITLPNAPQY